MFRDQIKEIKAQDWDPSSTPRQWLINTVNKLETQHVLSFLTDLRSLKPNCQNMSKSQATCAGLATTHTKKIKNIFLVS